MDDWSKVRAVTHKIREMLLSLEQEVGNSRDRLWYMHIGMSLHGMSFENAQLYAYDAEVYFQRNKIWPPFTWVGYPWHQYNKEDRHGKAE